MMNKIMYLYGGANVSWGDNKTTPVYCKKVIVLDKSIGNHKRKSWVRKEDGTEVLVRHKNLANTRVQVWTIIQAKYQGSRNFKDFELIFSESGEELREFITKNHPEELI